MMEDNIPPARCRPDGRSGDGGTPARDHRWGRSGGRQDNQVLGAIPMLAVPARLRDVAGGCPAGGQDQTREERLTTPAVDRRATAGRVPRRSHVARPRLPETEFCIQVVRVFGVCNIHRESAPRPKSIISSTVVAQAPAHDAQGRRRHRLDSPARRLRQSERRIELSRRFRLTDTDHTPRSSHLLLDVIACTPSMPIRLLGERSDDIQIDCEPVHHQDDISTDSAGVDDHSSPVRRPRFVGMASKRRFRRPRLPTGSRHSSRSTQRTLRN